MKSLCSLVSLLCLSPLLFGATETVIEELGTPVRGLSTVRLHPGKTAGGAPSLLMTAGQNNGGLFVRRDRFGDGRLPAVFGGMERRHACHQ